MGSGKFCETGLASIGKRLTRFKWRPKQGAQHLFPVLTIYLNNLFISFCQYRYEILTGMSMAAVML